MRSGPGDAWLSRARVRLARVAGIEPAELDLDEETTDTILDLARVAAHESGERTNAPLLCYLVGRAQATGTAGVDALADAVRRSTY